MELDDEPLIKILATSEELIAIEDAIAHYLEHIKNASATPREEEGIAALLLRLKQRLAHRTKANAPRQAKIGEIPHV